MFNVLVGSSFLYSYFKKKNAISVSVADLFTWAYEQPLWQIVQHEKHAQRILDSALDFLVNEGSVEIRDYTVYLIY